MNGNLNVHFWSILEEPLAGFLKSSNKISARYMGFQTPDTQQIFDSSVKQNRSILTEISHQKDRITSGALRLTSGLCPNMSIKKSRGTIVERITVPINRIRTRAK